VNETTTVRGRIPTVSSDHFQSSINDELNRRAQQARERQGGHSYPNEQHAETQVLLSAYIGTLPSNDARIAALKNLQDQLNPGPEKWVPSETQTTVLDVAGSDYRQPPPSEILLNELILGGLEDLAEARGQLTRDLTQRLQQAEAEAAKVQALVERTEQSESTAAEAGHEVERLRAELALVDAELHFQRNLNARPETEAEVEQDDEPTESASKKKRVKAATGGSDG
jgi:hypothetical protein